MSGLAAILGLGAIHGIVLAIVLRRSERHRRANQYLAAVLAALSVLLFDGFLRATGASAAHPHLIGLAAWVPFMLGPLVFLYVREMTAPDPAALRPAWRHFVVPAVYVGMLIATFYPRGASYKRDIAHHESTWMSAIAVALLVYGLAYAVASLVLLRRHRAHVQALYSNLRGVSLQWLVVLAGLNTVCWIAALVAFALRITGAADATAASAIVPISSTVLIFVTGYFQLGQAEIFKGQPAVEVEVEPAAVVPAPPASAPAPEPPAPRAPAYARARLADDDAAGVEDRMRAAMSERRLYQRPGLTLAELADEVAATPHEVSQVLSTRLQRNFYTFINEHRIEHVKAGLTGPERPLLDLAFEAGFQSKSTFNSAFRKATGMTPREFRDRATS
jgi:AraC-like DNA-binding protein